MLWTRRRSAGGGAAGLRSRPHHGDAPDPEAGALADPSGGDLLLYVQNYPLLYTFYELTPPSHRPRRSPTSNTPEPRVVADILDADRLAEVSWLLTDVRRCEGSSLAQYRCRLNIIVHREATGCLPVAGR